MKEKIKQIFSLESVICRLFASWFCFHAMRMLEGKGFETVKAGADVSFGELFLIGAFFFVLYSLLAYFLPTYPTDTWGMLLGSSICAFVWIFKYGNASNHILLTLAVVLAYAMMIVYVVRRNLGWLEKWDPKTRIVVICAALFAVSGCVILSVITCLRYKTFSSPNFDFGLFCNMFSNMRKTGLPLITSERDTLLSHFAVHISPIFYLLLPFYYVFPSPMTLQIGQAVILMAGVIPVVLLARHYKLGSKATVLLSLIYCAYPVLTTGCFYDIHENCFLPFFLLWTFYFFEKEKWIPMYLSAFCVLMVKEDAAIFLAIFAVYVILSRKKYLHGGILAAASVGYFLLATHLINTYGDGVLSNRFDNLIPDAESGIFGIVKVGLTNPGFFLTQLFTEGDGGWDKIVYFLLLLLPLGFLPFCTKRASRWLLLAPMLLNFLSYYQYLYHPNFQYSFGIIAFLMYAAVQNVAELKAPTRRTLLSIGAAAGCCLYIFSVLPSLDSYVTRWQEGKEQYVEMKQTLEALDERASLNVSTFLLAHVANHDVVTRLDITAISLTWISWCWISVIPTAPPCSITPRQDTRYIRKPIIF